MENTSEEIKATLQKEGLEQYISLFEKNNLLDAKALSVVKAEDYEKLGIENLGDRMKLVSLFSKGEKHKEEGCLKYVLIAVGVLIGIFAVLYFTVGLEKVVSMLKWGAIAIVCVIVFLFYCTFS
ncbi:MAG: hypothetical protein II821_08655 [Treponema sp.]|nr:hypothetical protein [Treponema sp.]